MSFKINTNIGSAFSGYQLQKGHRALSESLGRLSTGKRINKAADDASGMAIANALSSQAKGFSQAIRNSNDAISITQVADGALGNVSDILQDIRVKAIQAASGAQSPESRQAIQADIEKSLQGIKDIAQNTSFNDQKLLSGSFSDKQFQVGASAGETITISLGSIDPGQIPHDSLGTLGDIDVTTEQGAQSAIQVADAALEYIGQQRSLVGSTANQLESSINTLSTAMINTMSAESEIQDLDFAEESMNLNKIKILGKTQAFAQAQANTSVKNILDLFG
ncbi:MAG: flagellin [Desulfobacteraceae bacterium]|nr:flagellin [Desulfobacteraceae bacterium]